MTRAATTPARATSTTDKMESFVHQRHYTKSCTLWRADGVTCLQFRAPGTLFYTVLNSLKGYFEWACSWDADTRIWSIDAPLADVRSWAGQFFAEQEITVRGDAQREERRQEAPHPSSKLAAAFATLHLSPTAPLWAATAVHRAAARQFHPDTGRGNTEAMARINSAFDVVRAALS